jgi:hypothetical protein
MKRGRVATVYVMEDGNDRRKVGHSVNPLRRSVELGKDSTARRPRAPTVRPGIQGREGGPSLLRLAGKRLKGELFSASIEECVAAIERAERIVAGVEPDAGPASELLCVKLDDKRFDRIEDWRRQQPGKIPNRTDAIRALIDEGLASFKRREGAKERKPR